MCSSYFSNQQNVFVCVSHMVCWPSRARTVSIPWQWPKQLCLLAAGTFGLKDSAWQDLEKCWKHQPSHIPRRSDTIVVIWSLTLPPAPASLEQSNCISWFGLINRENPKSGGGSGRMNSYSHFHQEDSGSLLVWNHWSSLKCNQVLFTPKFNWALLYVREASHVKHTLGD